MALEKGSDHSTASTASMGSFESSGNVDDFADDCSHLHSSNSKIGNLTLNVVAPMPRTRKKRVRFGSLEVHEHAIELGGSSLSGSGPSTTLEWEEQAYYRIKSVEFFEDSRPFENRRGSDLLQSNSERINILLDAGYTSTQINKCIKEDDKIRKQRLKTIKIYQRYPLLSKAFGL